MKVNIEQRASVILREMETAPSFAVFSSISEVIDRIDSTFQTHYFRKELLYLEGNGYYSVSHMATYSSIKEGDLGRFRQGYLFTPAINLLDAKLFAQRFDKDKFLYKGPECGFVLIEKGQIKYTLNSINESFHSDPELLSLAYSLLFSEDFESYRCIYLKEVHKRENLVDFIELLPRFHCKSFIEMREGSSYAVGYWAKGSEVFDVTNSSHIKFIIENPEKFGLTSEWIEEQYAKYNEKLGFEGKAREEIIKAVSYRGWIRVRHYTKPRDYWSIQCDNTKERAYYIKAFIDWAIDNKLMTPYDDMILLGYDKEDDRHVYSFQDNGVTGYLMEEQTRLNSRVNLMKEESHGN